MSRAESIVDSDRGETEPERKGSGTSRTKTRASLRAKRRVAPVLPGLDATADAAWFAVQMAKKYPLLSKTDKHRVLIAIKAALPPNHQWGGPGERT